MAKKDKRRKLFLNSLISNLIILIFSILVSQVLSDYSYVTIIIKKGNNNVYYKGNSFSKPDEIYINGINQSITHEHNFIYEENNVTLIWEKNITSCYRMFRDCEYII